MIKVYHKTNGYIISEKTNKLIKKWEHYLEINLKNLINIIELFNYGDLFVMATVKLLNNDYAHYTITDNSIHFNGHYCNEEEYKIFSNATYNDDCHNNLLQKL